MAAQGGDSGRHRRCTYICSPRSSRRRDDARQRFEPGAALLRLAVKSSAGHGTACGFKLEERAPVLGGAWSATVALLLQSGPCSAARRRPVLGGARSAAAALLLQSAVEEQGPAVEREAEPELRRPSRMAAAEEDGGGGGRFGETGLGESGRTTSAARVLSLVTTPRVLTLATTPTRLGFLPLEVLTRLVDCSEMSRWMP